MQQYWAACPRHGALFQWRLSNCFIRQRVRRLVAGLLLFVFALGVPVTALAEGDKSGGQIFEAKLHEVRMLGRADRKAIRIGVDPRYVAKLELGQDVAGLGKKGEQVEVAIHSPSRQLWHHQTGTVRLPEFHRYELSRSADGKSLVFLGRLPAR